MNRFTKEKCIMCGKEFERRTIVTKRKFTKGLPANRITCSKNCSKRYNRLSAKFYSKHNNKIKGMKLKIKQIEGKIK